MSDLVIQKIGDSALFLEAREKNCSVAEVFCIEMRLRRPGLSEVNLIEQRVAQ